MEFNSIIFRAPAKQSKEKYESNDLIWIPIDDDLETQNYTKIIQTSKTINENFFHAVTNNNIQATVTQNGRKSLENIESLKSINKFNFENNRGTNQDQINFENSNNKINNSELIFHNFHKKKLNYKEIHKESLINDMNEFPGNQSKSLPYKGKNFECDNTNNSSYCFGRKIRNNPFLKEKNENSSITNIKYSENSSITEKKIRNNPFLKSKNNSPCTEKIQFNENSSTTEKKMRNNPFARDKLDNSLVFRVQSKRKYGEDKSNLKDFYKHNNKRILNINSADTRFLDLNKKDVDLRGRSENPSQNYLNKSGQHTLRLTSENSINLSKTKDPFKLEIGFLSNDQYRPPSKNKTNEKKNFNIKTHGYKSLTDRIEYQNEKSHPLDFSSDQFDEFSDQSSIQKNPPASYISPNPTQKSYQTTSSQHPLHYKTYGSHSNKPINLQVMNFLKGDDSVENTENSVKNSIFTNDKVNRGCLPLSKMSIKGDVSVDDEPSISTINKQSEFEIKTEKLRYELQSNPNSQESFPESIMKKKIEGKQHLYSKTLKYHINQRSNDISYSPDFHEKRFKKNYQLKNPYKLVKKNQIQGPNEKIEAAFQFKKNTVNIFNKNELIYDNNKNELVKNEKPSKKISKPSSSQEIDKHIVKKIFTGNFTTKEVESNIMKFPKSLSNNDFNLVNTFGTEKLAQSQDFENSVNELKSKISTRLVTSNIRNIFKTGYCDGNEKLLRSHPNEQYNNKEQNKSLLSQKNGNYNSIKSCLNKTFIKNTDNPPQLNTNEINFTEGINEGSSIIKPKTQKHKQSLHSLNYSKKTNQTSLYHITEEFIQANKISNKFDEIKNSKLFYNNYIVSKGLKNKKIERHKPDEINIYNLAIKVADLKNDVLHVNMQSKHISSKNIENTINSVNNDSNYNNNIQSVYIGTELNSDHDLIDEQYDISNQKIDLNCMSNLIQGDVHDPDLDSSKIDERLNTSNCKSIKRSSIINLSEYLTKNSSVFQRKNDKNYCLANEISQHSKIKIKSKDFSNRFKKNPIKALHVLNSESDYCKLTPADLSNGIMFPIYSPKIKTYIDNFCSKLTNPELKEKPKGKSVPCLFYYQKKSKKLIIYYHANAEDIFSAKSMCMKLSSSFNMSVQCVEYPGYSIYDGKPDENRIFKDSIGIYNYLTIKLGYNPKNLICIGRSLGNLFI